MNLAIAAAVTAIILFIVSQIERRTKTDRPWMRQLIMGLRLLVFVLVGFYLYIRLTS